MGRKISKRQVDRIYPTEDDPRYGQFFKVVGFQLKDLDGRYTKMLDATVEKIYKVAENYESWLKQKRSICDMILTTLDNCYTKDVKIPFREVCSLNVLYLADNKVLVV